ncbi:unnamed protein product [Rhizophagus irregularis]|nr:unnamed protein product [Rhizophagus irregularis]
MKINYWTFEIEREFPDKKHDRTFEIEREFLNEKHDWTFEIERRLLDENIVLAISESILDFGLSFRLELHGRNILEIGKQFRHATLDSL